MLGWKCPLPARAAPQADVCGGPGERAPCARFCRAGGCTRSGKGWRVAPRPLRRSGVCSTPRAGLGPSSWVPPPARGGGTISQGPRLCRSLRAESPMGSFPHLGGQGAAEGRGLLLLLAAGSPCGVPAPLARGWSRPVPCCSIGLCRLPAICFLHPWCSHPACWGQGLF